ncbi:MAG: thioredoxin domain-containing protein [Candidatus Bathyarchaeia archaeon]
MLIIAYTETYQATGKEEYEHAAREIITYVMRDMTAADGGFYSAEDADTEGEEGKFYLWTEKEIREALSADEAEFVIKILNVEKEGNFEDESLGRKTGRNILHLKRSINELTSKLEIPLEDIQKRLESIRQKLFAARGRRVRPDKDDKILTDWNGLMIAALAKAVQVFNDEIYVNAAKKATDFIIENMRDSKGRLYHRYRDGEAVIPSFLDDYAFFVWGLIELYETTFEVGYLQLAISLTEDMIERFWDEEHGGFYFTANDAEEVLVRNKKIYDSAYPSGNSVAMLNLLRLARLTAKPEFENKAVQIPRSFSKMVSGSPSAYTQLLIALDFALGPSYEIVVVGKSHTKDTKNMLSALRRKFIPNKVVLFRPAEVEQPEITHFAEFTRDLSSKEGRTTAYVCRNYACNLPTTRIEKMLELLNARTPDSDTRVAFNR